MESGEQGPGGPEGPERTVPNHRAGELFRFSWFFYLFLALAGIVWIGLRNGTIPAARFFSAATWWRDLGAGLLVGGLLLGCWSAARRLLAAARQLENRVAQLLGPIEPGEALGLAFLSGTAEEIFFRGAVQDAWGWLIAAVLFALLHTGPGSAFRLWTLFAAVAGLALGGVTLWTGNLLAPIAAHILVNAVGLARIGRLAARRGAGEAT